MITFEIDEIIPCLKNTDSGEIYETEVVRIRRKSFLSKFNKHTGWYVNWGKFDSETEIYALVLKGTMDIQGMIAIKYDAAAKAVYLLWGCTAPHNNPLLMETKKYSGVGGHLFAIASDLSLKKGYEGYVYAEAMNEKLYEYYINTFGAMPLPPIVNPYRFMLSDETTARLREVYNYEWTDEII